LHDALPISFINKTFLINNTFVRSNRIKRTVQVQNAGKRISIIFYELKVNYSFLRKIILQHLNSIFIGPGGFEVPVILRKTGSHKKEVIPNDHIATLNMCGIRKIDNLFPAYTCKNLAISILFIVTLRNYIGNDHLILYHKCYI